MGADSFPGVKRPGSGVDHPISHLAPRLKKEQSYTSTHALGFYDMLQGDLCLYFLYRTEQGSQNKMTSVYM